MASKPTPRTTRSRTIRILYWYVVLHHLLILIQVSTAEGLILVVGATGGTGLRALQGLLDVGFSPQELRLVTRSKSKPLVQELQRRGFHIVQADLEQEDSLHGISTGCSGGCYIHSTSSDLVELDTGEVQRARNLHRALRQEGVVRHVVYNSAAAAPDHGVGRIAQKHQVEDIFRNDDQLHFTSLRANIFMEELWKQYTRPTILAGKYPLPIHRQKKLYLTSVRDMGRLAGHLLQQQVPPKNETSEIINVAGDYLTGPEIAQAFAEAQQSSCRYYRPWRMEWKSRFRFRELWEQIQFMQRSKEFTDIEALRQRFPGLLTTFPEFLAETHWGDRSRAFTDFANAANLKISSR